MIEFISCHLYLLAVIYFSAWWAVLFMCNRKGRKAMASLSLAGCLLGPLVQHMHLQDWWQPAYVSNTVLHIEDIVFGFAAAGVASSLYAIIRARYHHVLPITISRQSKVSLILLVLLCVFGLFYVFGISSFWSSVIGLSVPIGMIAAVRRELLAPICVTGIVFALIALPGYLLGIHLDPDWIRNEWLLDKLSGVLVVGIPLEELTWFLFAGMGIGAFQELLMSQHHL